MDHRVPRAEGKSRQRRVAALLSQQLSHRHPDGRDQPGNAALATWLQVCGSCAQQGPGSLPATPFTAKSKLVLLGDRATRAEARQRRLRRTDADIPSERATGQSRTSATPRITVGSICNGTAAQREPGRTRQHSDCTYDLDVLDLRATRAGAEPRQRRAFFRSVAHDPARATKAGAEPATSDGNVVGTNELSARATGAGANLGNAAEQVVLGLDGRQRATRAGIVSGNAALSTWVQVCGSCAQRGPGEPSNAPVRTGPGHYFRAARATRAARTRQRRLLGRRSLGLMPARNEGRGGPRQCRPSRH